MLRLKTAYLFGKPQKGRDVYVRQSYVDLVGIIMLRMQMVKPRHKYATAHVQTLILGTPGIGKSLFLAFLMWSIIQRNRGKGTCIVYRNGPSSFLAMMKVDSRGVDFESFAGETTPDRFVRAARKSNCWVLLDACKHLDEPEAVANTVMVTSPRDILYNEYKKFADTPWMPVWDWPELTDCHLKVFNDTVSQEWLNRVAEVSGMIPQLVFEAASTDVSSRVQTVESDAHKAMLKDLNQLNSIVDEVRKGETVAVTSHLIVHCWVSDNYHSDCNPMEGYRHVRTRFASPYVHKTMMDRLVKAQLNDIKRIISGKTGDEEFKTNLYEAFAHYIIPLGGQYRIKRLDGDVPGTEEVATFPPMPTREVWNLKELVQKPLAVGEYCQPTIKNLGAVDSLVKPDTFFQMTTSVQNPLKAALLQEAMEAIDHLQPTSAGQQSPTHTRPQIRLFFVIPEKKQWSAFGKQPYHSADLRPHVLQPSNIPLVIRDRIEQWALLFTVNEQFAVIGAS